MQRSKAPVAQQPAARITETRRERASSQAEGRKNTGKSMLPHRVNKAMVPSVQPYV